ncbi:MAG: RNA methyltransferase [Bacteroidota bacterium]|nr:RNA methyltransferase [Bacteroidota bacterium]
MITKNQIKRILSLHQKKFRKQHNLFFVEGQKSINEFLSSDMVLEELYTCKDNFKNIPNRFQISPAEMQKISALSTNQDSLAVFQIKEPQPIDTSGLIVALDQIRDPGNLGTIIRLCDWFGIKDLVCSYDTVDIYNPKVLQATMGSITRVNINYVDLEQFLEYQKNNIYGTFLSGDNIYTSNLSDRGIIVMGNEANGISPKIEHLINQKITIPRFGTHTESLNVATATSIVLSEFKRRSL